jgi:chaperonin GroEL
MQPNPKQVNTTNAQEKMLQGVEIVYAAVSSTLGPRSRNVAIKRPFGTPAVIHDGVKAARSILPLEDEEMDTGAEMAVEAANKTNEVGDGTTTATVLMREIARSAHKNVTAGARTMALREGIEAATDAVLLEIDKLAQPIEAKGKKEGDVSEQLLKVSIVSAQVEDIGRMVAEAYAVLGDDGILTAEQSGSSESMLELKTGMQFDQGWISPYFMNQDSTLGEAILENTHILVTDDAIRDHDEFVAFVRRLRRTVEEVPYIDETGAQQVKKVDHGPAIKEFVVIAADYELPVQAFMLKNNNNGAIRVIPIKAPSYGEKRVEILKDIAALTGATLISQTVGTTLQSADKQHLGTAARITSTRDTTLIVDGGGAQEDIDKRIATIKEELKNGDLAAFDREKLKERLARLSSGIGVLRIGGRTEPEMQERLERAYDSISAARAALTGGIVAGGGITLMRAASHALEVIKADKYYQENIDYRTGVQTVIDACKAPFSKLMTNSGFDAGEMLTELRHKQKPAGPLLGVDVMDGKIVDLIKEGIIDPLLVVKAALGNASSAAVSLFTSDTLITEIKQPVRHD